MSAKTRRILERNFIVPGAAKRGLIFTGVMLVLAYLPNVAAAFDTVSAALTR